MTKVPYTKQIQTFANQIGILKQRGMVIANEHDAEAWLRKVSYYRMSGYWYPLLADRQNHIFKSGSFLSRLVCCTSLTAVCDKLYFPVLSVSKWLYAPKWLM